MPWNPTPRPLRGDARVCHAIEVRVWKDPFRASLQMRSFDRYPQDPLGGRPLFIFWMALLALTACRASEPLDQSVPESSSAPASASTQSTAHVDEAKQRGEGEESDATATPAPTSACTQGAAGSAAFVTNFGFSGRDACILELAASLPSGTAVSGTALSLLGPALEVRDGASALYVATEHPMSVRSYSIDVKSSFEAKLTSQGYASYEDFSRPTSDPLESAKRAVLASAFAAELSDKRKFPYVRLTLAAAPPDRAASLTLGSNALPPVGTDDTADNAGTEATANYWLKGVVNVTSAALKAGDAYGYELDLTWTSIRDPKRSFTLKGKANATRK